MAEVSNDLKRLLLQVKEENDKAGLHLNLKKTEAMATEEIQDSSTDNGDTDTVHGCADLGSVIGSEGDAAKKSREGGDSGQ